MQLSRREFLQTLGTTSAGLALAASGLPALAAPAAGIARAQNADVIIKTSGWPLAPLRTEEEVAGNPSLQGYNDALSAWMEANPNVAFETIEANIWDQQAITPLVVGGTAPTYIFPDSLGGWSMAGARAAFVQGLMADVTPAIETYGLKEKLTDGASAAWEPVTNVDGRYYGYPIDSGHQGFFYRRDLLEAAGLEDPPVDWTWDDLFAMARALTSEADSRKGFGAPTWAVGDLLGNHGFNILARVPDPSTGWNWVRDHSDPKWAELVEEYRKLVFEDQAVYADAALGGNADFANLFINGNIAITAQNVLAGFGGGSVREGIASVARQVDRPFEEVIGFRGKPRGDNGFVQNTTYVGNVALNPDVSADELDKSLSAVDYMFLGAGWDIQKAGQFLANQDLQDVFNYPLPIDGKYEYEGVPGTFADAYGQRTLDDIIAVTSPAVIPNEALFFLAEADLGPGNTVIDDAWSTLTFDSGTVDASAVLNSAADTWNQQAAGFVSSHGDDQFIASAQAYFSAMNEHWAASSPEFHANVYQPWYESVVLPALGG